MSRAFRIINPAAISLTTIFLKFPAQQIFPAERIAANLLKNNPILLC